MTTIQPTVLIYGLPKRKTFLNAVEESSWGLVLDNGKARDVVFTMYENFARADAMVLFPGAHPAHLVSVLAEAEVGHPLIQQEKGNASALLISKPIIFAGSKAEWKPFWRAFSAMQAQGLLRNGFDRTVTYCRSWDEAKRSIEDRLPPAIRLTRIHYYLHTKKQADLSIDERDDVRPPSTVTIACFGSASTKNSTHLARTEEVARVLARNNWNILHGGGTAGVMGQLSKSGAQHKAYIKGVTVHASGAPKISFERSDGDKRPDDIDAQIASKDMLHRIETYAGHSHAFVSLDGGIGSVQEILVVAELLSKRHPVVMYKTATGAAVAKPLLVMNEGGCYTPFLAYLQERGLNELLSVIQEVRNVKELDQALSSHLLKYPPQVREEPPRPFRELYGSAHEPLAVPRRSAVPEIAN